MLDQIAVVSGASMPASAAPLLVESRPAPVLSPSPQPARQAPVAVSGTQEAAVEQVNLHLAGAQTDLKLMVDRGSGRTVFQVIKQTTGQVLLQVPSAEVLGMSQRVRELQNMATHSGGLVDQQG